LKLSVAGHLTIFLTRTRGPFWSIRPARILWIAVLGTQMLATLIAVYGLFMTPLGWKLAGLVWAYALVCFLITDRLKLVGYRLLDHAKADEPKQAVKADGPTTEAKADAPRLEDKTTPSQPDDKAGQPRPEAKADVPKSGDKTDEVKPEVKAEEPKPEIKAEAKPKATADAKPADKTEPQPEAKTTTPPDLKPQIAKLAYELYESRGHGESSAVQDWEQAESEIRKDEAKAAPKPQTRVEPETEAEPETSPEVNAAEPKPDANDMTQSDVTPKLVKRVHELYEQLGREDVQAVQEWEIAKHEIPQK